MSGRRAFACTIGLVICGTVGTALAADEPHPYRETARVRVDPVFHDYLSGPAFNVVRDEASRIWLRHGVALTWNGTAVPQCDALRLSRVATLIPDP